MRIEFDPVYVAPGDHLAGGLSQGEEFVVTALARVRGVEDELLDVTSFGDEEAPRTAVGDVVVTLTLSALRRAGG